MEQQPDFYRQLGAFHQRKRYFFCDLLSTSRFRFTPAAGTYFQLVNYSEISDVTDVAMAEKLTQRHGIAAIPISVFYQQPPPQRFVSFYFAKEDETLQRAAKLLCQC